MNFSGQNIYQDIYCVLSRDNLRLKGGLDGNSKNFS